MAIDIATAKECLKRIDEALDCPHILIGGLAVEQYYKGRDSKDIDLVCDHKTAKSLLRLFPTNEWEIDDRNDDAYRPSYEIRHQIRTDIMVIFGPKISEREPYNYLNWEDFRDGAVCFKYKNEIYKNILIPTTEALAFTKLVSSLERRIKSPDKSLQDFEDYINLSNHKSFNLNKFVHLIKKANFSPDFIKDLSRLVIDYSDVWELSNIKFLIDILISGKSKSNAGSAVKNLGFFTENYVENSDEFKKAFSNAKSLAICGYSQNRMAVTYAALFEKLVENGGLIRLVVMDPEKPAILYANRRSSNPVSEADVKHQHSAAIGKFKMLRNRNASNGEIKIRLVDIVLPFTIYGFDLESPADGKIFVWLTPFNEPSSKRPGFALTMEGNAYWYEFFQKQFEKIWLFNDSIEV